MIRGRPSQTAEGVCLMRATDQRRPAAERILDDPYAKLFLGPMMRAVLATWEASGVFGDYAERYSPGVTAWVLCRHRYIDDCLRGALDRGVEQVVILGAGYDMRAYRLAAELGGRPVFEVDFPATRRRKARILERAAKRLPKAEVRAVEIDFQRESLDERLLSAGFRAGLPTFFAWEGVTMYLTRAAVKTTLATVASLGGAGSEIALDFWYLLDAPEPAASAHRFYPNLLSLLGEPVTFAIHPEDVEPFLERLGFRVVEIADARRLEERYVRDGRRVYPAAYAVHADVARKA